EPSALEPCRRCLPHLFPRWSVTRPPTGPDPWHLAPSRPAFAQRRTEHTDPYLSRPSGGRRSNCHGTPGPRRMGVRPFDLREALAAAGLRSVWPRGSPRAPDLPRYGASSWRPPSCRSQVPRETSRVADGKVRMTSMIVLVGSDRGPGRSLKELR